MKEGEDEGGTLALQMSEDLSNKNWADIMQEEQYMAAPLNDSPEREPSPLPGPPYFLQVACIGATNEDIFFIFGGEDTVKWMNINEGKGKVELHDENAMRRVLALHGEMINEEILSVEIPENRPSNDVRMAGGISGSRQPPRFHDTRHDDSYHRGAPRQDTREYSRGGYQGGHHERERGFHHGGYGGRGGHVEGGYGRGRGGGYRGGRGHDGYHPRGAPYRGGGYGGDMGGRYEGPGGVGRSNSHYGQQRDYQAAPITRSRTESTSSYATAERAPSRFSCDAPISPPQGPVVEMVQRKPSAKSIFGDAKPVDTSRKLCEVEEKLAAEKEKKEKERKEKEAEEKKRLEEEKREKDEERKRKEDERRRLDEERVVKTDNKVPHQPIQILRRPKTESDGPSSTEIDYCSEEKGEKRKEGDHRKKHSFKKDEKEKERDGDRERSQPKTMRTFSNSSRIVQKSGSVEHEESTRGGGRGRGVRGSRGRGIRGSYSNVGGRKNSVGSNVDPSMEREKEEERQERQEKKEESKDHKEKENDDRTEKKTFNIQSRLYSDGDASTTPSSHSIPQSLPPPLIPRSIPAKDIVDTTDGSSKGDGDKNTKKKGKGDEKEEVKEEKKVDPPKTPTPRKKNKGKEKDKSKFASNNKFAALLEENSLDA